MGRKWTAGTLLKRACLARSLKECNHHIVLGVNTVRAVIKEKAYMRVVVGFILEFGLSGAGNGLHFTNSLAGMLLDMQS